ncbi:MAG TPA: hypothetical protein VG757_01925 [Devosia sp.]|nr:hypothetical protein [Devosia sp.]
MKEVDIGPDEYRKQDRHGRWVTPTDPKALVIGILLGAIALGYIFWHRDELAARPDILFGVVTMFSFFTGMIVAFLIRRL